MTSTLKLDPKQTLQKRRYDKIAGSYNTMYKRENANHVYKIQEIGRCLFGHLNNPDGRYDIMEVGCGTGIHAFHFLREYHSRIRRLLLTDISEKILEEAKKLLHDFSEIVDFAAVPAENISQNFLFDGIYVSGALHHFSDPEKFLREAAQRAFSYFIRKENK